MSSSSRALAALALLAALLVAPASARALSVHAVYRTACSRELGVILKVEKRKIHLLRLDGAVVTIPRHEIVSLLYYPLGRLPLTRVPALPGHPPLTVTTRYQGAVVELVTGWPIDYSDSKISFLLPSGEELVIDRNSIWSLAFTAPAAGRAATEAPPALDFVHPQTSGFCAAGDPPAAAARPVFAQQILNDQIVIRRELDRLADGYLQILEYEQDQKFYPVPFLYRDRTMLGLWVSAFSRYGASTTRSNNLTPLLVDELALGPFRYQHLFLSGAAPNEALLHHEAQSQIYYRFKAAYFHTSVFFDPNLLLVGTRYDWRPEDLADERLDDRLNEALGIELGFDWGPLAIELTPAVIGYSAVKLGDVFESRTEHNLWRVGARLTFPAWRARLVGGFASTAGDFYLEGGDEDPSVYYNSEWAYRYARLDLGWQATAALDLTLSAIARGLDYSAVGYAYDDEGASDTVFLRYDSTSVSTALRASYALGHRFSVGGNAIVEVQRRSGSGEPGGTRVLPRFGVFTGLWF